MLNSVFHGFVSISERKWNVTPLCQIDEKVVEREGYSCYQCAGRLPEEPMKKIRTGNQGKTEY